MEEKCKELVEELNKEMFDGIPWFKIKPFGNTGIIGLEDGYKSRLFVELSYASLYSDIAAFLYGVKYSNKIQSEVN